jgi:DNA-binding NtrC family response regulator
MRKWCRSSSTDFVVGFMSDKFNILVADRNRHVREFLQRELGRDGYRVEVARDGREVLLTLDNDSPPDLLVLDLDIPCEGVLELVKQIYLRAPEMPVVIHTLLTEFVGHPELQCAAAFVEKSGDTDKLRTTVRMVLQSWYETRRGSGASGCGDFSNRT